MSKVKSDFKCEELESLNQNFLMNSERLESIKLLIERGIEMFFILMILRIQIYLMRAEESWMSLHKSLVLAQYMNFKL